MVAAAKLRRAQDAAQNAAALCRAHGRGDRQPGGRRLRRRRAAAAGRHRLGPAPPGRRGDLRPRPRRRLQLLHRARRARADRRAARRGQGRQDHHRRPQGPRPAAPPLRRPHRRQLSRPAAAPSLARAPRRSPRKIRELFEAGEVDVVTLFFSRFKSVVTQTPTAQAADPGRGRRRRAADRPEGRGLRVRAGRGDHPRRRCCRATSPSRSSPPCWRTRPASSPPR